MSASPRSTCSGDNILARLERGREGASFAWTPGVRVGAIVGLMVAAALIWILVTLTRDRLQVHPALPPGEIAGSAASSVAPAPVQAPPDAPPLEVAPPVLAEVIEAPALASAAAAAPPRPQRVAVPVRPTVAHLPRRRVAGPAAPAPRRSQPESVVDSDVALLSAILMHAPRHSAERARAQSRCADDKACQDGAVLQEALKATD